MKRSSLSLSLVVALIAGMLGVPFAGAALAADATISVPTLFTALDGSASDDDGSADGCFTVDGNLTIDTGGSITNNDAGAAADDAGDICIIVSGDMVMNAGSAILAENNTTSGSGGDISITVGGNLTLAGGSPGAKISSSDNTGGGTTGVAGNITIVVGDDAASPPTGDFVTETGSMILANSGNRSAGVISITVARNSLIDGTVESDGGLTGVPNQPLGGGMITVDSGCDLSVSTTGLVSSEGNDPGSDLVHLEAGCEVLIEGVVRSTGVGHSTPVTPNHCNSAFRPGKDPDTTACVEIWAGNSLIIDGGEVHADTGGGGGPGEAWIDLFAEGDIQIFGDTTAPYAVHANGLSGGGTGNAGTIAIKSTEGSVTATELAVQADSTTAGGDGGNIQIEAAEDVALDTATLSAQGDSVQTGGYGVGGRVGTLGPDFAVGGGNDVTGIRAYNGTLSWTDGEGNVRPTGVDDVGTILAQASRGEIIYQDCTAGTVDITGTTFPFDGTAATTPTELADDCDDPAPVLPSYVELPTCVCEETGICNLAPTTFETEGLETEGLETEGLEEEDGFVIAEVPTETCAIDIEKTGDALSKEGDQVTYTFDIENIGLTTQYLDEVDDVGTGWDGLGDLTGDATTAGCAELDSLETCQFTVDYTVQVGDPDPLINTVTATYRGAADLSGPAVTDNDSHEVNLFQPSVEVTKDGPTYSKAGDTATFEYNIRNTSSFDSPDLILDSVVDDVVGDLETDATGAGCDELSPETTDGAADEEDCDFTADYTVLETDPDPLVNEVTVHYHPENFPNDITDKDDHSTDLVHPNYTVTKDCLTDDIEVGDSVTFEVVFENTGDVPLDFAVDEDLTPVEPVGGPPNFNAGGADETFFSLDEAGGTVDTATFEVSYVVTEQDLDQNGNVTNELTATATLPALYELDNEIIKQASATCDVGTGATRTIGFWRTHDNYLAHIFNVHRGGAAIDLGTWISPLDSVGDILGVLWASPSHKSNGKTKRSKQCQARINTSKQAIAAILNTELDNGAPLPAGVTEASIANTLQNGTVAQILALGSLLDAHNNGGDDQAIVDGDGTLVAPASPKTAKATAFIAIADSC